jgi:tetratricopeptide (TPR) repeat protein
VDWINSILEGARESVWQRLVVSIVGGALAALLALALQKLRRSWLVRSTTCRHAARVLRNEGERYAQMNHRHNAMELFDLSVQLNPNDPHVYYLRGNLHAELGNPRLATADWTRCLALFPEHHDAKRRVAEIGELSNSHRNLQLPLWIGVGLLLLFALVAFTTR